MSYYIGIDVGSRTIKGILVSSNKEIVDRVILPVGWNFKDKIQEIFKKFDHGIDEFIVVATGVGKDLVDEAQFRVSEVKALSTVLYHVAQKQALLIDIGGQDIKYVEIDDRGKLVQFKYNNKCGAGTGAFIEEIAWRLSLPLEDLYKYALESKSKESLSSICTVFAGMEILQLLNQGKDLRGLCKAALNSVGYRIFQSFEIKPKAFSFLSGGVVYYFPLIVEILSSLTQVEFKILPQGIYSTVYGAILSVIK